MYVGTEGGSVSCKSGCLFWDVIQAFFAAFEYSQIFFANDSDSKFFVHSVLSIVLGVHWVFRNLSVMTR